VVADDASDDTLVTAAYSDQHASASLYRHHLPSVYSYYLNTYCRPLATAAPIWSGLGERMKKAASKARATAMI